jgi:hypothetical protein
MKISKEPGVITEALIISWKIIKKAYKVFAFVLTVAVMLCTGRVK